jgi:hypothetical protein
VPVPNLFRRLWGIPISRLQKTTWIVLKRKSKREFAGRLVAFKNESRILPLDDKHVLAVYNFVI